MNISAIYHRSTVDCCYAADRDTITVNLRTAKDVDRAWLVWEDPFIHELRRQRKWEGKRQEMSVLAELRHNYIWTVSVAPSLTVAGRFIVKPPLTKVSPASQESAPVKVWDSAMVNLPLPVFVTAPVPPRFAVTVIA